eukprot:g20636.t1
MRQSHVYVFEPSVPDMEAQFADSDFSPVERCRLYFNFAVFQAIVLGRVRYAPIDWTKHYEISDADFRWGLTIVEDTWIQWVCGTSS